MKQVSYGQALDRLKQVSYGQALDRLSDKFQTSCSHRI